MKTIRKIVLKWARFMDKRRWELSKGQKNRILNRGWGGIPYTERRFPNIKWWKGLTYQLCIKTIRFINKIDPLKEYETLEDWEKDIIKRAREGRI